MLEYIFFNKKTCELFEKAAILSGIKPVTSYEDECFTVRLIEDSDEAILEELEEYYDELMDMDRELSDNQEDPSEKTHIAGITIQLKDGRTVYASIAPELLARVMQNISADDLNTLVCAITEAVENPDGRSLCQR